jgi:hypothetical protein
LGERFAAVQAFKAKGEAIFRKKKGKSGFSQCKQGVMESCCDCHDQAQGMSDI